MTYLIGLASFAMSLYIALTIHPFESGVANTICFIVLCIIWSVLLCISCHIENRFEERIQALEDKLNNKEATK